MVIIRIKGGLGNQLFQYAAGYALAKRLNQALYIDNSFFPNQTLRGYKLNSLQIDNKETIDSDPTIRVRLLKNKYINKALRQIHITCTPCGKGIIYLLETKPGIVDAFFKDFSKNVYIDGYYQSEVYFREYRTDIVKQFTPAYESENEYMKVLEQVKNCCSVAVHVRRGDFIKAQNDSNPRHYLLGKFYYQNALNYITERVKSPVFFWFSDDIEWVKQNFGIQSNFRFISLKTKHADIDEMMLMKNCRHIISANSTFSWWAAWLNENGDAIRLVPEKAYGIPQMIPNHWIKISIEKG